MWLFCVVVQDCDHVSQTAEEFYTVRCQVADMKNIYVSIPRFTTLSRTSGAEKRSSRLSPASGVSGRGDHQRHARGRQHVHVLPVWKEGPRREKVSSWNRRGPV